MDLAREFPPYPCLGTGDSTGTYHDADSFTDNRHDCFILSTPFNWGVEASSMASHLQKDGDVRDSRPSRNGGRATLEVILRTLMHACMHAW